MDSYRAEQNLHVFDTEERVGVSTGLVIAVGDNRGEAQSRIRDESLAGKPGHDSTGHLKPDTVYDNVEYLGTMEDLRDDVENDRERWIATGISSACMAGELPEEQYQELFEFLTRYVNGKRQIVCLEIDCGASQSHLGIGAPDGRDLQCQVCDSGAVIAVQESEDGKTVD